MSEFDKLAAAQKQQGMLREFWYFLGQTKKWWLLPILLIVFVFGLLIVFSGTAAAPFIYTLF